MLRPITVCGAFIALVTGCATSPKDISPSYVSPLVYQNLSCEQLAMEGHRISARAAQLTGTQSQKATSDAVAVGVGAVLFWPALFFIRGDRTTAAELSRLRGELDAVEQASIANKCGITVQTYEPTAAPQ